MFKGSIAIIAAMATGVAMAASAAVAGEMVEYQVVDGSSIPASLTGKAGDPVSGRKLSVNRKKGNCLACHKLPIPEQQFHGDVGPDLAGVASRYNEGEIRLRVVNSKVVNQDTIMPAFYRADGFHRVLKKFQGKSILSAPEVEDIIAYLTTLKDKD